MMVDGRRKEFFTINYCQEKRNLLVVAVEIDGSEKKGDGKAGRQWALGITTRHSIVCTYVRTV